MLEKGFELNDIEPVLDACESSGFINDNRYAELLVRSHISRGHGAIRIRQAIAQKGLAKDCIEAAITNSNCDWFELAKDKATKKYGIPRVTEVKGSKARISSRKKRPNECGF